MEPVRFPGPLWQFGFPKQHGAPGQTSFLWAEGQLLTVKEINPDNHVFKEIVDDVKLMLYPIT
jgi:hypothetical protein